MGRVTNKEMDVFIYVMDELEAKLDSELQDFHDMFVIEEEYEIADFILKEAKSRGIRIKPTK
tara:strand:+ start:1809 stop:1994 length:186 start_codon:yes stop_codon:yes gene_type:complete